MQSLTANSQFLYNLGPLDGYETAEMRAQSGKMIIENNTITFMFKVTRAGYRPYYLGPYTEQVSGGDQWSSGNYHYHTYWGYYHATLRESGRQGGGGTIGADTEFCPECGRRVSPEDKFCRACGKQLQTPAVSAPERAPAQAITNSIGMKMVWIPPGEFLMGRPDSEYGMDPDERPQHRVRLTKGFYLGVHEVTQRQWQAVMGTNPSYFKGADLPVENVSWEDAVVFCRRLSAQEGVEYRLPTEAEWEYACRAGSTTRYNFGDGPDALEEYSWCADNSRYQTHVVGQKRPNAWGLYDMHGNVCEWCQDWHGPYAGASVTDPRGPASGEAHVQRGGAWDEPAPRSAFRGLIMEPDDHSWDLGFRLARTTPSYP